MTAHAPELRSMARGSAANLLGSVVTGVATFGLTVLVARGLPRAEAGVFFSATSIFLLATALGQLGTPTGVVYFVAKARTLGHQTSLRAVVRSAAGPVLVVGVITAALGWLLAGPLARLSLGDATGGTTYLRLLAIFVPLAGLEVVWLAGGRGLGSMRANALIELVGRPVLQVALVAVALPTGNAGWIALAWAAPYLVAAAAAARSWNAAAPAAGEVAPEAVAGFWRFTGPRALTSVVQVVMQRFDIVLVAALAGVVDAAVYAAATRFIVVGQFVTVAFTQAAQPHLGRTLTNGDTAGTNETYRHTTAWTMLLCWPMYLVMLVFPQALLRLFGHGYAGGAPALLWLSLSMLVATGCGLVDVVLAMAGRTTWNLANAIAALVCNLALDLWLIPRLGVAGAAIGWAVAISVRNLAALTQIFVAYRLHPFGRSSALAAGVTLVSFGALPVAVRAVLGDKWDAMLIAVGLGGLCWLVAVWLLRAPLALTAFALRLPSLRDASSRSRGDHGGSE